MNPYLTGVHAPMREELTALTLAGTKTTTASPARRFREQQPRQDRRAPGDPSFVLADDTVVVLERFRIVERLTT